MKSIKLFFILICGYMFVVLCLVSGCATQNQNTNLAQNNQASPNQYSNNADRLKSITKDAEQGNVESQFLLGLMYYTGTSIAPEDKRKAVGWLQKAAAQGHKEAQGILDAKAYVQAQGEQKTKTKAGHAD